MLANCPSCHQGLSFVKFNKVLLNSLEFCNFPHYCGSVRSVLWLKLHEMERHAHEDCPRYECPICKVKLVDGNYMTGRELRKHLKYKCPDVRVVCTLCKKPFKRV